MRKRKSETITKFFFEIQERVPHKVLAAIMATLMLAFAILLVVAIMFVDTIDGGIIALLLSSTVTVGIIYDTLVKYPKALSKHPFASLTICITPFVMMAIFFWYAISRSDGYPGSITLFLWANAIRTFYMIKSYDDADPAID